MALPVEKQIQIAWRAISSSDSKEGWGTIPLYRNNNWLLVAGYSYSTNEHAIFLEIHHSHVSISNNNLPQAQGFRVQKLKDEDSKTGLALIRQFDGDLGLFTKIASDVCNTIIQNESFNENKLISLFMNRINAWLSFMRKGFEILSPEAEIGLIGELETLSNLILANIPITAALNSWLGPLDGLKDFELGTGAIEIKSTLSSNGFIAKIGSLEQLDDSDKSPLFINGHRFSINATGKTLGERVIFLQKQLINFPTELLRFNNLLLRVGYLECTAENYSRKFKTENSYFWLVDEKFPKLVAGNVALNIRQAKYEIDLTPFINQSIDLKLVLQKLGIVNSGIN